MTVGSSQNASVRGHRHVGGRERGEHACTRGPCRARSAARARAAGGAAPSRASPSRDAYVRFERPPEISVGGERPSPAPSTCAANHGRSASRSTPGRSRRSGTGADYVARCGATGACGCGLTRRGARAAATGRAVALRVAGDPADGHVDAEARRRRAPLRTRRPRSRTRGARAPSRGTGSRTAHRWQMAPGLGLAQQRGPRAARRRARRTASVWPSHAASHGPGERTGEDQVRDGLGCHRRPPGDARWGGSIAGAVSGSRWGVPAPRSDLQEHGAVPARICPTGRIDGIHRHKR